MIISSHKNERIKFVKSLIADKKVRNESGLFVAEGINFVCDMHSKCELHSVYYTSAAAEKDKVGRFLASVNCERFEVTDSVMCAMSDTVSPSGLLAVVKTPEKSETSAKKIVVLDGVSDPGNVGTIIRTAAAFGFGAVIGGEEIDFYSPKIVRSTMTGILSVDLVNKELSVALDELNKSGYATIALDMNGTNITDIKKPDKVALIVGSEAHGISEGTKQRASVIASIPMSGAVESLNAAVAACVAMYELTR